VVIAKIGNWDYQKAVPFRYNQKGEWVLVFNTADLPNEFEFKFILRNAIRKSRLFGKVVPIENLSSIPQKKNVRILNWMPELLN
jgi:hypothetical protein